MANPQNIRVWNPANPEHLAFMRLRDAQLKGMGMSRVQIAAMREAQRAAPPDNLVDDQESLTPAALRAQADAETESVAALDNAQPAATTVSTESTQNVSRETFDTPAPDTVAEPVASRRVRTERTGD